MEATVVSGLTGAVRYCCLCRDWCRGNLRGSDDGGGPVSMICLCSCPTAARCGMTTGSSSIATRPLRTWAN